MSGLFTWFQDMLSSLWGIIESAFNFLMNTIHSMFSLVRVLPTFINYLTDTVGYLPSFISIIAVCTISIAIIYLILGRSTNE